MYAKISHIIIKKKVLRQLLYISTDIKKTCCALFFMVCQTFAAKHSFAFNDPFLMVNLLQKSSKTDQTIKVNNRPTKIDNRH